MVNSKPLGFNIKCGLFGFSMVPDSSVWSQKVKLEMYRNINMVPYRKVTKLYVAANYYPI